MILALFIKRYLYNGKELIEDNGLHYYDYGARMYDASIGRWSVVDPMGEKYVSNTSYNYALNNPILLVDPDGREIHVSNLSASHQKSLLDFSRTKEGKAFLAQFAVGGKEYVIAGERVSFEGSGQYANQHLFFSSTDATPTGRTISKLWNPRGHFKRLQEVNMGDVKESLRSKHGIGIGYDILIGNQQQGDDALYTIAHESFLHVNKTAAKVQRGIDDYRSGKLDQDAEKRSLPGVSGINELTSILLKSVNEEADHKLFVDGKAVDLNNFVKSLDELFGGTAFSDRLKDDKQNVKRHVSIRRTPS